MSKKLFSLVKSMSSREKGHFKNSSFKHTLGKQNVYITLFDVIDAMNEYDSSRLQAAFEKKKPLKEIAAYSNYLFVNILDALKIYHARKTVDSELRQLLLDVEVLCKKSMFREAQKIIVKIKNKARVHECFSILTEAIGLEEKIAKDCLDFRLLKKLITLGSFERLQVTNKQMNFFQYESLRTRIFLFKQAMGSSKTQ
jgi:hypothetical protein